jgi:GNAT superfamily N-acetyltransferase
MPLTHDVHRRIRDHWAERLGCAPSAFERPGASVVENGSERTVRLLRRGDVTVVAGRADLRETLASHNDEFSRRPLAAAAAVVSDALSGHPTSVGSTHGPAVLGYVDTESFRPVGSDARLLAADDERAFERLRQRIPDHEWQRASPTFRPDRTAGLFSDSELTAVATLGDSRFPDIGVVVAPERRNQGHGQDAVSRLLGAAFARDRNAVPCYRTPAEASASLALAASVGFERWASEAVVVLA